MKIYESQEFQAATNEEIYPEHVVETTETIDDFRASSKNWAEKKTPIMGKVMGYDFIVWPEMQARKGMMRAPLTVIDFGDYRGAIENCDIRHML